MTTTNGHGETVQVPVTVADVCRWADAFDAYYESEAVAVPNEPSFRHHLDVAEDTWLSRWEAHRSVAAICRLVRDHLAPEQSGRSEG